MFLIRVMIAFLVLACAQAQQPDRADLPDRPGLCDNASTQLELNQCTAEQLKVVRARLSALYNEISADLVRNKDAVAINKLKAAQQAWLKYRQLHCDAARHQSSGASMSPMIWADCMTGVTLTRIQELKFAYPVNGKPRE
jgi:uncharacterized protein YecT (DUF1311 family)